MDNDFSYWNFIEKYHPRYYSDDRALLADILFRYASDDEVSPEDLVWIHEDFQTKDDALVELTRIERQLLSEALANYHGEMAV